MGRRKGMYVVEYKEFFEAREALPTIRGPQGVVDHVAPMIAAGEKEMFVVLTLNTRNEVIGSEVVSVGTLNSSLVHPREIFRRAVTLRANAIIVSHNHPSGDVTPSDEDIGITKRLREAGRVLGIELLDHVIVAKWQGGYEYCSMKERRLLK